MNSLNTISKKLHNLNDKKIVLVGGCFDILHIGHLRYLKKAKKLGDILVVGINGDKFIRKTKGFNRPIIPEKQRVEMLNGFECVDYVFITNRALYDDKNIRKIKPHFLVFANEKNKIKRRKIIAKDIEKRFPNIKTVFLSSGINLVRTSVIENRIMSNKR